MAEQRSETRPHSGHSARLSDSQIIHIALGAASGDVDLGQGLDMDTD